MKRYFYRIGHPTIGLWYAANGEFSGAINTDEFKWLQASCLNMPFEPELVGWISVADSLEHLYQWFSRQELIALQKDGYVIEEWIATDYKFYELYKHNVIKKETSILNNKFIIV